MKRYRGKVTKVTHPYLVNVMRMHPYSSEFDETLKTYFIMHIEKGELHKYNKTVQ